MPAKPRAVCLQCGERTVVPVVYGYPGPGMIVAADRREIILGGCCLPATYRQGCTVCGWLRPIPSAVDDEVQSRRDLG